MYSNYKQPCVEQVGSDATNGSDGGDKNTVQVNVHVQYKLGYNNFDNLAHLPR